MRVQDSYKRKTLLVALILFLLSSSTSVILPHSASAAVQVEYYVAPNGSDTNPGTQDLPFATIQHARDEVRTINSNMTGDIYVYFAPGTYHTPNTVNFTAADSGTNGFNIIYKNLGDVGSAKFVGGVNVNSSWTQVQASTSSANPDSDMQQTMVGKVYKTNLLTQMNTTFPNGHPATSGPLPNNANGVFSINTLYVNDIRATQARTLNSNKYPGFQSTFFENPLFSAGGSYTSMTYKFSDAANIFESKLANAQNRGDLNAQIVTNDIGGGHSWESNTLPITNINTILKTLTFNPNNVGEFAPLYWISSNSRYYLQGNLAFLDTPGEFYFNRKTYDLYYYPKDNETNLAQQDIVIPTTQQIINITGERTGTWDSTVITPVQNIVFDGLKFEDTSYPDYFCNGWPWLEYGNGVKHYPFPDYAKNSSNPTYSGQSERPQFMVGVLTLKYAQNITITNSHIKNAGMMGIELGYGTSYNTVSNSLIEYTGHAGVDIQGGFPGVDGTSQAISFTNHNLVDNLVIHDVGQLNLQSHAVGISNATNNTVSHIEMYNSPRRAILLLSSNVQGWDNGWLGDGYTNQAFPYNLIRDQYAHHNTFSNIYIHNVQQDGGDDGGIFTAFLYYPRDNYSQPNYFNQIVLDKVAANPNMTDISPNNINFDMGWLGIHTSNIKTVNANQYNIENSNLQNGQVIVDNASFNFFSPQDGLENFDDSEMDYANIGVQTSLFPAAYAGAITDRTITPLADIYFSDNFENGLDWTKWLYSGVRPTISKEYMSEGPFNGTGALNLSDQGTTKSTLYRNFSNNLNKVVTVDFFDRVSSKLAAYNSERQLYATTNTYARVDNGTAAGIVAMGVDTGVSGSNYMVKVGGTNTATNLRRTTGWHTLKFDYTDSTEVKLYIDNNLVKTINGSGQSFNYVALGSPNGNTDSFFDQLYIFGGTSAPAPESLPAPAILSVPGKIEAEDFSNMWGVGGELSSEGTLDVGWINKDDWMEYKVNVASTGTYQVNYRVSVNSGATGGVNFLVDGVSQKITALPSTGGWQNWTTVSDTVNLSAGVQTIRLKATGKDWNFNWFELVPIVVTNPNPFGYWKLDETSGTTASDSSGNNKTGTLNGGASWGAGKIGNGLSFNGTNSYVDFPDSTNPVAFTVSLWVKPSATTAQNIWTKTNASGATSTWSNQLRINSSGKFEAYTYDGAGKTVTGTTAVQPDVWYHIALVATNNGQMKLYVNGQSEGTPVSIGTMWTGGTRFWLGSNAGNVSGGAWGWYNGMADDVKLYNSALNDTDIVDLYSM